MSLREELKAAQAAYDRDERERAERERAECDTKVSEEDEDS